MRVLPFKFLMGKTNLGSALFLSFALHIVFVTFLPSMALNRTSPLKEKNHNKVRITMLTKADSPKVEKKDFKPKSIREPHEILKVERVLLKQIKVARVLPKVIEMSKPSTRQQSSVFNSSHRTVNAKILTPQKVPLKAISNQSRFHKNSPDIKIVQINPKIKSSLNVGKLVAGRPNPKKIELRKVNSKHLVSHASILPMKRASDKFNNPGFQAPVAAINSNAETLLRQADHRVKHKAPSDLHGSVNTNAQSRLISVRSQGSSAVRVMRVMPRQMASVNFDEPPKKVKVASEAIAQILNDFYLTVGKKIAYAKTYPAFARKMGYQGKILVAFRIGRDGKILSLSVSKSSGYKILDEAALEAVKGAGPYPPIPKELNKNSLNLKIPISYALR